MNIDVIKKYLDKKINQGLYSGCALVFGKPFEKKIEIYKGTLSKKTNQEINSDTVFDLQSITKAIASGPLAIHLEASGQIKLDQKIEPYLKILKIENEYLSNITFNDLLTHTSGLSDADLNGHFQSPTDLWKHIFSAKPHFAPGTSLEYADLGYRVLGKLLETILKTNLEVASQKLIWEPAGLKSTSYAIRDVFNVAATPDASGTIDDEQVHFMGNILGCDGVFSNATDLFNLMSSFLTGNKDFVKFLKRNIKSHGFPILSYFDALAVGPKSLGWETNPAQFTYSGKFKSSSTFEKAGGAGTFIWFDAESEYIFVYLTNYGKPKPFDDKSWNHLLSDIGPADVSNLIYENL